MCLYVGSRESRQSPRSSWPLRSGDNIDTVDIQRASQLADKNIIGGLSGDMQAANIARHHLSIAQLPAAG